MPIIDRISIHALREESDHTASPPPNGCLFQSTLSVRRATGDYVGVHDVFHISIHALREESDWALRGLDESRCISIHALREESDIVEKGETFRSLISIHALREESDQQWIAARLGRGDFNPRSP